MYETLHELVCAIKAGEVQCTITIDNDCAYAVAEPGPDDDPDDPLSVWDDDRVPEVILVDLLNALGAKATRP